MDILIFVSVGLILYTYLLFPGLLFLITRLIGRSPDRPVGEGGVGKSIVILCAMYNEERSALGKIQNFLSIDEGYSLLIGSDGSTDGTNAVLESYNGKGRIKTFAFPRRGKVYVLNDLMDQVTEDIVIFTDANTIFEKDTIPRLIEGFSDPTVGAVCGCLKILDKTGQSGEGLYWRYETAIKKMESRLSCLMGANGSIYAIRRELLDRIPLNTINDDFVVSMRVVEKDYKVLYMERAVVFEESSDHDKAEFKRHVRDGAGHYRAIPVLWRLLNPLRFKAFFLYISHRLIRWITPFLLAFLLMASIFYTSQSVVINILRNLFLAFSFLAASGALFRKVKVLYMPFYFCYINLALMTGFFWNFTHAKKVAWDTNRK